MSEVSLNIAFSTPTQHRHCVSRLQIAFKKRSGRDESVHILCLQQSRHVSVLPRVVTAQVGAAGRWLHPRGFQAHVRAVLVDEGILRCYEPQSVRLTLH
jgi:hypothetical protein